MHNHSEVLRRAAITLLLSIPAKAGMPPSTFTSVPSLPSFTGVSTTPKNVEWTEAALRTVRMLTVNGGKELAEAGVLGRKRPVRIKVERIVIDETSNDENSSSALPSNTKIVHFQRHGQGYHNLIGEIFRESGRSIDFDERDPKKNPFVRPELVDSPLTAFGLAECATWRGVGASLRPDLIVVSPLQRAIRTATGTFADHIGTGAKWMAHEGCREDLGLLSCNRMRPASEAAAEFPFVDFGGVSSGESDSLWGPDKRETRQEQADRAYGFVTEFLRNRPEREIAVVTHSSFLFTMFNAVFDCGDDEDLRSWFMTSEIRSVRISFSESQ